MHKAFYIHSANNHDPIHYATHCVHIFIQHLPAPPSKTHKKGHTRLGTRIALCSHRRVAALLFRRRRDSLLLGRKESCTRDPSRCRDSAVGAYIIVPGVELGDLLPSGRVPGRGELGAPCGGRRRNGPVYVHAPVPLRAHLFRGPDRGVEHVAELGADAGTCGAPYKRQQEGGGRVQARVRRVLYPAAQRVAAFLGRADRGRFVARGFLRVRIGVSAEGDLGILCAGHCAAVFLGLQDRATPL